MMKQIILLITLCLTVQVYAQQNLKSGQIQKDIQALELENDKIIMSEYIKTLTDSTYISLKDIGENRVKIFQNKYPNLKKLKEEIDKNQKELDAIKRKDVEYKAYRAEFDAATTEGRKKMNAVYQKIFDRIYKSDKDFKQLYDKNKKLHRKLNYQTLIQIINEYHDKGETVPSNFINYTELREFKNLSKVKENQSKIRILNQLYDETLEKELRQNYNLPDKQQNDNVEVFRY